MSAAAVALTLLLITPFDGSLTTKSSCLSDHFYGNYRDGQMIQSVLIPEPACLNSWLSDTSALSASMVEATQEIQQLVWVEEEAVDIALKAQTRSFRNEFDSFLDTISAPPSPSLEGQDVLVTQGDKGYELLYRTPTAALLSVSHDTARTIDTIVPRFWRSTLLPTTPVQFHAVSPLAITHVQNILDTLKPDPKVASLVESISIPQMKNDIRFLTGEDPISGIISRHSFSEGSRTAAKWLKRRIEDTGATCELKSFLTGFAPNVVCRYPSLVNTTSTILISAHYDSRGSFGSTRAPGGDDDGSGTVGVLSIARTIKAKGIKFLSNVELVLFAGEEQGLLGSKAYARELKAANANLTLVIQADMLAYRLPGEPPQLGLPDLIGTPELAQLVSNISAIYSPELVVGVTQACCSDHQSFFEQGFPSTQVFERTGPIVDPMYHNSGDLSDREGYDFDQLKSIAKVQFATILHAAGYELSK